MTHWNNTDYNILLLPDRVAANWKIQNGPFGTLYGPQRIQKKCSEQLRSRSIRWRGQMVHRAKIKIGKRSPGQKWTKNWCKGFARKACFLMVWGRVWPLRARFLLPKHFFVKILIDFDVLGLWQNFGFHFLIFSILSFFQNFWFSSISLQKWLPPYPGAIKTCYPEQ